MSELKIGRKNGPRESAKRFEKLYKKPLSKRIVDFLKEEGRKENVPTTEKRIAQSLDRQNDLDV